MKKVYIQKDGDKVVAVYAKVQPGVELEEVDASDPIVQSFLNPPETYAQKRNKERGSLTEQWEYFLDNGYDAMKAKDDAIKAKHPKP